MHKPPPPGPVDPGDASRLQDGLDHFGINAGPLQERSRPCPRCGTDRMVQPPGAWRRYTPAAA